MELLDSTGVCIHIGDKVWFKSKGKETFGVVETLVMSINRHWHTKVERVVTTVKVRGTRQQGWAQLHIFHKPEHLTVVERPS